MEKRGLYAPMRVNEKEMEAIKASAKKRHLSVSSFIRCVVFDVVEFDEGSESELAKVDIAPKPPSFVVDSERKILSYNPKSGVKSIFDGREKPKFITDLYNKK